MTHHILTSKATAVLRTPAEYEWLAEWDTALGEAAWNRGDIRRATSLWMSAARWSQYARRTRGSAR